MCRWSSSPPLPAASVEVAELAYYARRSHRQKKKAVSFPAVRKQVLCIIWALCPPKFPQPLLTPNSSICNCLFCQFDWRFDSNPPPPTSTFLKFYFKFFFSQLHSKSMCRCSLVLHLYISLNLNLNVVWKWAMMMIIFRFQNSRLKFSKTGAKWGYHLRGM